MTPSVNAPPADRDIIEGWFSEQTFSGDAGLGQHLVAAAEVKQVKGLFLFLDIDLADT